MTSDACPTCGDLCGMREFGWEKDAERHTLATIRAEYARYLTHHDTYELARAVGQVISEPVDVLPEDQRVVVQHPDDEEDERHE